VKEEGFGIQGFKFSAVAAGIKHAGTERPDFGLIVADAPAAAAAVTTSNLVCAAPVEITRQRIQKGLCRAVLVNSGNANAYTGERGKDDAKKLTAAVAQALAADPELVIPMSTGVIGNPLPCDRMSSRVPELVSGLSPRSFMDVARAIMTTDTRPKTVLLQDRLSTGPVTMTGMAKGAGMIAPKMATMLAVILTDIKVPSLFLRECLVQANSESFNCITVDGDTSTNDTLLVMAGGRPDAPELAPNPDDRAGFGALLAKACMDLARQVVRDGEGATKLVEVRVCGAPDKDAANRVARAIAQSPLVKTAFHGADPNWGRIICAAGAAEVAFDPNEVDLFIGNVPIVSRGGLVSGEWESAAHAVMLDEEFSVLLDLKAGSSQAIFLTTDFSEEYVTINADYRS
jgi:glutamate N-acetyltransferase / amino-acid N-acetyltransferase